MKLGWRVGLPTCTAGCIAGHTVHCRREGFTSRKPTDENVRSGSPHWKIRSSNTRWSPSSTGFMRRTSSASRMRPERSQHQALDALSYALVKKKVNYVLDADIHGFFDNLDKAWMIKFIEHRVADRRILRLIQKWLKVGVMEEGKWSDTDTGTPQGSVISPF